MNEIDKERYLRQIALDEVGEAGQARLKASSALIVGVGGLGSPIATLLAAAGIGRLGLVDFDTVSLSNLPRQTLYTSADLGRSKLECARKRLAEANPAVEITTYELRFDDEAAQMLVPQYDMIIDGCDNMATRYVMDRASQRFGRPYIYGAIRGFEGQVSVFNHLGAGAYSDLFAAENALDPQAPPPVMATTPTLIGAIQANEALKIAIGYGTTLAGRLLSLDSRDYSFNIFDI